MNVNSDILRFLTPRRLVLAYCEGVFPMVENEELMWFSPDPRGILPLDERFHISRSLARTIRRGRFECTVNRAFSKVMHSCANRCDGDSTWISPEIMLAYEKLHQMGLAHSVEAWPAGQVGKGDPVGGLYGVALGGAFFAESMFHTVTDAGKVAVVHLVRRLAELGFTICDVQWTTDNLRRFGACDMPRQEYMSLLHKAIVLPCQFA